MLKTECEIKFSEIASSGKTVAIIVAGGSSSRMQGIDKQFYPILSKPVLLRTLEVFNACDFIDRIVVVGKEENLLKLQNLVAEKQLDKVSDIVSGGENRAESVRRGIDASGEDAGLLLIHDGARPLITAEIIESVKNAAELYGAAAPGVPLKDTIKKIDASGKIIETPERDSLVSIQTPQGFRAEIYKKALLKAGELTDKITDDCMLVEAVGESVYIVEGSYENIKITNPIDIILAETILKERGEGK